MPPNRQLWRGLVDYANEPSIESDDEALKRLAKTLWDSMGWMARTAFGAESDVPEMIAQQVRPELGVKTKHHPWVFFKSEEQLADQFRGQAVLYQPSVRNLLTWLADPNDNLQSAALAFLREHTDHIEFQRADPAFAAEGEEEFRYFTLDGELKDNFPHRTLLFKDIADVICDFVQREHEAGESAAVQICKRPGCGNLVARLKKRQFCRTTSCDRERQKRDDDTQKQKNRDAVMLCRLNRLKAGMRQREIRKRVKRLHEIESYWRERNQSLMKLASKLLSELR